MLLTQADLEKIGIDLVGDQKAVLEELAEVKRAARRVLRDQILWSVGVAPPPPPPHHTPLPTGHVFAMY